MFQVDDSFQQEVGIANMPAEAKAKLIEGITKMINDRVLIKLSDQITNEKIDELEKISTDDTAAKTWLMANIPNYAASEEFVQFSKQIGADANPETMFAINKWFMTNLPTYPSVLEATVQEVKEELKTINGK